MTKITLHKVKRTRGAVWMLRWYGTDGKRYGETIGKCAKMLKGDALEARQERQGKVDNALAPVDRPARMTLADFLARDREAVVADLKSRTIAEMATGAKHAINVLGADFDVRQLKRAEVGRIKKYLADRKLAAATIVKVLTHLQGAFSRGIVDGAVTANPFLPKSKRRPDGVRHPKIQPKAVRTYKPRELEALMATAPDLWWATFIRLAYTSGLREGELLNLLWSDVDLEARTVTVAPKKAGTFTAGDQGYPILPWTAKDYETRTVPIPPATVEALRKFLHFQEPPRSAYVFLGLDRLAVMRQYMAGHGGQLSAGYKLVNNLKREWDRLQAHAAVELSVGARSAWPRAARSAVGGAQSPYSWTPRTIHELRKTYGTMATRHVDLHELKRLMGHSSIKTTERHYLGVDDGLDRRIGEAFSGHARDTREVVEALNRPS